jgi:hypothetical protein
LNKLELSMLGMLDYSVAVHQGEFISALQELVAVGTRSAVSGAAAADSREEAPS